MTSDGKNAVRIIFPFSHPLRKRGEFAFRHYHVLNELCQRVDRALPARGTTPNYTNINAHLQRAR